MSYERELHVALRLARRARTIALRYYRRRSRVTLKDNLTPVTAADRRIERLLADGIGAAFPNDRLIGEEHGVRHGRTDRFWTIDPIDGTRMFVQKTGNFSTMIGLVVQGRPVLGVVAAHAHGRVYYGVRGHGSFVLVGDRRRRLRIDRRTVRLADATLTTPDPKLQPSSKHSVSNIIRRRLPVRTTRIVGSAGLDLSTIAAGRATVSVIANPNLGIWDAAPGQVILEEAGGIVTTLTGHAMRYRWGHFALDRGIVATTPLLRDELTQTLRRFSAARLMAQARRRSLRR